MPAPVIATGYAHLGAVCAHYKAGAVISITGPEDGYKASLPALPHLRLEISDIHCGSIWSKKDVEIVMKRGLVLAQAEDVREALRFARLHTTKALVVHCAAGTSRSAAIALSILSDRLGKGYEAQALAELLVHSPHIDPNPYILGLADTILNREGALQEVISALHQPKIPITDLW